MAGHPGLLCRRPAGRPAVDPTADPRHPGAGRRSHLDAAARLGHCRAGLGAAPAPQPDRLGLYVATGLVWSLQAPWTPWIDHLVHSGQPLPLAAQLAAVLGQWLWAPAIALGITLPALLLPDGRLRSPGWRVVAAGSVTGA